MRYKIVALVGTNTDTFTHPKWHRSKKSAIQYAVSHFFCHNCQLAWVNFHIKKMPETPTLVGSGPPVDVKPEEVSNEYPPCSSHYWIIDEGETHPADTNEKLAAEFKSIIDSVKNPSYN
jgi:hypothetical protein